MRKISIAASLAIALALISGAVFAAPTSTAPAKQKKPSLLSKIIHHGKGASKGKGATGGKGSMKGLMATGGQIIGDKNTKVYHLASDKYALPAEKNRVYFKTVAQAEAAGYHHAGAKSTSAVGSKKMGGKMTGGKMAAGKSTGKKHAASKKKGM
jgi:hypothetical protein